MNAGTLEIQMLANLARLADDMQKAKSMVGGAMKDVERAVAGAKSALAALGVGLGVGYFVSLIKGTIDAAEHLNDLRKSLDLTVGDLAGLQVLARQSGTDMDGLAKGVNRMSVEMGKTPEKFRALGVTAKDNVGAFKQLADIFNLLPDIQQRNALAQAVFSKSWAELAPALSEGSKGIQEAIDKGKALSGVTDQLGKDADKFNDQLVELNTTLGATRNKAVGDALPAFNEIANAMKEAAKEGGLLLTVWVGLGGALAYLLGQTDSQKVAARLKEINDELERANKQLRAGSINPEGTTDSIFSFLIPDVALGEAAVKKIQATVRALEQERDKLKGVNAPAEPNEWGFSAGSSAGATANQRSAAAKAAQEFLDAEKNAAKAKEEARKYTSALQSLEQQLGTLNNQSEREKILYQTTKGSLADLTAEHKKHLLVVAAKVDVEKTEIALSKSILASIDAEIEKRNQSAAALEGFLTAQSQLNKDLQFEIDLANLEAPLATAGLQRKEDEIRIQRDVNIARETAIALRKLENDFIRASAELSQKDYDAALRRYELQKQMIPQLIAEREAIRAAQAEQRSRVEDWNRIWGSVENIGKQAFVHILADGEHSMKSLGVAIKASVIDLLYELTARKWIINIGTSFAQSAGIGAAGGAAGVSGIGSGLGSSIGTSVAGSQIGQWLGLGAAGAGAASAIGLGYTGAGLASMGGAAGLTTSGAGLGAGAGFWTGAGATGSTAATGLGLSTGGAALGATEAAGGAAAAGAGMSALAMTGYGALAIGALYAMGAFDSGPDAKVARGADLQFVNGFDPSGGEHFSMGTMNNYGAHTADENPLYRQLVDSFENKDMWDQAKLHELVGTRLTGSYEGGSAALVPQMLELIKSAAIPGAGHPGMSEAEQAAIAAKQQADAAETQRQAQLAAARHQMDIALLEAQGKAEEVLAAQRQDELAAMDETLRPLQQQIYAAQDAAKAADAAAKAADNATQAEQALAEARSREASAVDNLQQGIRGLSGQLGVDSLQQAIAGLSVSEFLSPTDRLSGARGAFDSTLAAARGGDLGAVSAFPQAVQTLLSAGRDVFASGPDFQNLFREANQALSEVLRQQQDEQSRILSSVPIAIQQAANDQIGELRRGFTSMVDALEQVQAEVRRLRAA